MYENIGIVGFAFGLRDETQEPNPSNSALARVVTQAGEYVECHKDWPIVVTQWEITKGLNKFFRMSPDHSVELRSDGTYLDSRAVWEEAKFEFALNGVKAVIIIAQPFLHLPSLKRMVKADGYSVHEFKIPAIPFDDSIENTQPWTRSKLALVIYAIKSLIPGMKHGHNGMQNVS